MPINPVPTDPVPTTLVLVPTYNEAENIASIVDRLRTSVPFVHILIVDDASPDGTGPLADAIAARDSSVHVLHRTAKTGLGAAYLDGLGWGLGRGYTQLVQLDADGSHLPEQLASLLAAANTADVVMGSRWVPGGAIENWPWHRRALSRGGSLYSRLLLRLPQRDATGGYRVYSARALERMDLSSVDSLGYCFQIEMLLHAVRANLRVVEVPITFVERVRGSSKMSPRIAVEAMARVTLWGVTGMGISRAGARAAAAAARGA
ncbi:MAG: polyprenol monophosphomannose synthase [Cryobacterium sp.]|uniref:polyprenol monophosphomannose synthase n=1 Tax=Cryobacterium sp. TaxID=1926290 RepID=UPI002288438A|nr:polyprenol monophosphomannose synthase [Cryobacterium sp.]MCY7403518.1 polyprenol monophosphomannose synthase [Cryobacterium sp.]